MLNKCFNVRGQVAFRLSLQHVYYIVLHSLLKKALENMFINNQHHSKDLWKQPKRFRLQVHFDKENNKKKNSSHIICYFPLVEKRQRKIRPSVKFQRWTSQHVSLVVGRTFVAWVVFTFFILLSQTISILLITSIKITKKITKNSGKSQLFSGLVCEVIRHSVSSARFATL